MVNCNDCEFETRHDFSLWNHFWRSHSKCYSCDKIFQTSQEFKGHVKNEHNFIHQCDDCDQLFSSKQNLKFHGYSKHNLDSVKNPRNKAKIITCDICGKNLVSKEWLKYHKLTKHFVCSLCNEDFENENEIGQHMKEKHDNESLSKKSRIDELHVTECPICKYKPNRKFALWTHCWNDHLKCIQCEKTFETSEGVGSHFKEEHRNLRVCDFCNKCFSNEQIFTRHLMLFHPKGRKDSVSQCKICQYKPKFRFSLWSHSWKDHSTCFGCDTKFNQPKEFSNHMKKSHDFVFPCGDCYQIFSTSQNLKFHRNSQHAVKDLSNECKYCQFKAIKKFRLWNHVWSIHTSCIICEKTFDTSENVRTHFEQVHKSVILCDLCDKCFSQKRNLEMHKSIVHTDGKTFKKVVKRKMIKNNSSFENFANECHTCDFKPKRKFALWNHFWQQHSKCYKCDKHFSESEELREHLKALHSGIFVCEECCFCASTQQNLQSHQELKHLLCVYCKTYSKSKHELHKHLIENHDKKIVHQVFCDICNYSTTLKSSLTNHIIKVHNKCLYCDESFGDEIGIGDHMRIVHNQQILPMKRKAARSIDSKHKSMKNSSIQNCANECHTCEFKPNRKFALWNHFWQKHSKCYKCDKHFPESEHLRGHLETHHPKIFVCEKCFFCAGAQQNLQSHQELKHLLCVYCKTYSESKNELQKHLIENHGRKMAHQLFCAICDYSTSMKRCLDNHLIKVHKKCLVCDTTFGDQISIGDHMRLVHNQSIRKNTSSMKQSKSCPKCEHTSSSKSSMDYHLFAKHCFCYLCKKYFDTKEELKNHLISSHDKVNKFECDICKQSMANRFHLKTHLIKKHAKCDDCKVKFENETESKNHLLNVHKPKSELLFCDICNKIIQTKEWLKYHMLTKHHVCSFCKKNFANENDVVKHLREIHGANSNFKCDMCDYTTFFEKRLKTHRRQSHIKLEEIRRKREIKSHICNVCDFKSGTLDHLKYHKERKHFMCIHCKISVQNLEELKAHLKESHDKNLLRYFPCSFCDNASETERFLKNHVARKHKFCIMCKLEFKEVQYIQDHMLNVHNLALTKKSKERIMKEKIKLENEVLKDEHMLTDISGNKQENEVNPQQYLVQKCFVKLEKLENEFVIIEKNN